jgi:putative transposase
VLQLFRFRRTGRADLAGLSRLMSKVRRDRFLVQPETMLRWRRDLGRRWAFRQNRRPGRPALPAGTVQLVMRLAREDPTLGYRENHGKPATMGVGLAPSSVWTILRRHGVEPSPKRSGPTWSEFVGAQATTMLAGAFFHVDTVLHCRLSVLFFIGLDTRRVHVSGITTNPVGVGHPSGSQSELRPGRAGSPDQVPDPGPRCQVHRQFRRGVRH